MLLGSFLWNRHNPGFYPQTPQTFIHISFDVSFDSKVKKVNWNVSWLLKTWKQTSFMFSLSCLIQHGVDKETWPTKATLGKTNNKKLFPDMFVMARADILSTASD